MTDDTMMTAAGDSELPWGAPRLPPYHLNPEGHMQTELAKEVIAIGKLLLDKNTKYGNSALSPLRVHSKANPIEQLNVRLDDKLSRMQNMKEDDEDTELDYIGYLILRRVARRINNEE